MELTVVGHRAGMPADGGASSGYLVNIGGSNVLMDCGPGIAAALTSYSHARQLDAIVISHMHLDHCYDVLPIGKQWLLPPGRTWLVENNSDGEFDGDDSAATTPIKLIVPHGARATLDTLAGLFPVHTIPVLDRVFDVAFEVCEYRPGDTFELADCRLSLYPLAHSVPDCGIRIESPTGSLAYTGDTGWTDELVSLASGVDLFLAEASLVDTDMTDHGHLSAAEAGKVAEEADARSLVLTHLTSVESQWLAARRRDACAMYGGPVHIAAPGARFTVRPGQAAECANGAPLVADGLPI